MSTLPALIDDLVAANRILAGLNVLDGFGHVSVRHPEDPTVMEERWLYVNPQAWSGLYWIAFPNRAKTWQTTFYASNFCRVGVLVMDDDHRGYVGDPRLDNAGKYELALYRVATPGAREARVEDLPRPTRAPSLPWDLHRAVETDTTGHASLSWEDRPAE